MFRICAEFGIEVVVLEEVSKDPNETLAADVIEILTVFSARLDGRRSHRKKRCGDRGNGGCAEADALSATA